MIDPIYVGKNVTEPLLEFVKQKNLKNLAIVADTHTYKALGQQVENTLKRNSFEVHTTVLEGHHIHADEHQLIKTFIHAPISDYTFIAVGSGTITDITRLVSHRSNRQFIAMPTAPSVDGFTSVGAPIILAGVKTTIICQAPLAVFADIEVLRQAPHRLIAAGFGDMLGKITSLADWRLGSLLWNEPFDEAIAARSQKAIDKVIAHADEIGQASEQGIQALMDTLIESGLCMLDFGSSRPASGAEHHISHYWEMKRLKEGAETPLHGAQVGYALSLVAKLYEGVKSIDFETLKQKLNSASWPNAADEKRLIQQGYGEMADEVIKEQATFLNVNDEAFNDIKQKMIENWSAIQDLASRVPDSATIVNLLKNAGAPASYTDLGLQKEEVQPGIDYGHFLRNRFTVTKLSRVLGLPLDVV
jgi:glycerol-1-phosphate dehydrogenase [NAD(P)+]